MSGIVHAATSVTEQTGTYVELIPESPRTDAKLCEVISVDDNLATTILPERLHALEEVPHGFPSLVCDLCVRPLASGTSNVARRSVGKVGFVVDCLVLALCTGASGARPRHTPCRNPCQPKALSRDHVRDITSTPLKFLKTEWKMPKVATCIFFKSTRCQSRHL